MAGVSLTVVSISVALAKFGDLDQVSYNHSYVGVVVLAMACLNVLGGVARPGKDDPKRVYFNWGHRYEDKPDERNPKPLKPQTLTVTSRTRETLKP